MVSKAKALGVWMNGFQVGELRQDDAGGLSFAYVPSWLTTPGARPVSLSMPLRHQAYAGQLAYNFFDNLLPDNKQIRDRIQARFKAPTSHPFDLLAAIGVDCVGAVQIVAPDQAPRNVHGIERTALTHQQIAKILKSYRTAPLGMSEDDGDEFRISIGGAQEKTALLWKDGAWHRPRGTTPTTHILKLPIGKIEHAGMDLSESCENEWLCLKIAAAFGIPVCNAELATFDGVKVLVVERFDRRFGDGWIMRLPQEDMCQALGISPNIKYESDGGPGIEAIMRLLLQSRDAVHGRATFFKSQVLFWLLAAIDGHAKNFSVYLEPEGRFRMTPLYDIMSAHPLVAGKQLQAKKIKMAMALTGDTRHYLWHTIQPRHFISTARQIGFNEKTARGIVSEMLDAVDGVVSQVENLLPSGFPTHIAEPILAGMRAQRDRHGAPAKLL